MKNTGLKLLPSILMLVAGGITSIMTYFFEYELKTALWILLLVLIVFYILGLIVVKIISSFDTRNAEEKAALEALENTEGITEDTKEAEEITEDMLDETENGDS